MNKIYVTIEEGVNNYVFNVVNEKEKYQLSLKKTKSELCTFYRNQSISLIQLKEKYKHKSRLSKVQLIELYSNMVFLYTMQCILRYVARKMGFNIVDHDFKQYKELERIEVDVHEK
jgi:NADH dehydrogenase/NADH:ubiquinone oxidoreductase subunit G